jgi:hypothetical protein
MPSGKSKAEFVADVLNKTIYTIAINCTKAAGTLNYFDVGVIAYGTGVTSALAGPLAGSWVSPIGSVSAHPLRVEERTKKVDDGAGGLVDQRVKFPVWFVPTSYGGTSMCAALAQAAEVLVDWCDAHPHSYPPTVLHVTDGESTDGDPEQIAADLRQISTTDGECLLFNLHVSAMTGGNVVFPTSASQMTDEYSQLLFRMSSCLPAEVASTAMEKGYSVTPESRGLIINANPELIVDFFDIGTRPRLLAAR